MSYIKFCASKIEKYIRSSQLIVLESTVYPGATEEYFLPIIKKRKFEIGKNYFLGFSPEREDPGNKDFSIKKGNIPKVISGHSKKCLKVRKLKRIRINFLACPEKGKERKMKKSIFTPMIK